MPSNKKNSEAVFLRRRRRRRLLFRKPCNNADLGYGRLCLQSRANTTSSDEEFVVDFLVLAKGRGN